MNATTTTEQPTPTALASATGSVAQLPPLEGDLKEILGKTCLTVAGLGRRLHDLNLYEVPRRVEEEQAAALHWMLNLYLAHGKEWRTVGEKILKAEAPQNGSSSATRPAGRMDCNQSAMAGFAAAHG